MSMNTTAQRSLVAILCTFSSWVRAHRYNIDDYSFVRAHTHTQLGASAVIFALCAPPEMMAENEIVEEDNVPTAQRILHCIKVDGKWSISCLMLRCGRPTRSVASSATSRESTLQLTFAGCDAPATYLHAARGCECTEVDNNICVNAAYACACDSVCNRSTPLRCMISLLFFSIALCYANRHNRLSSMNAAVIITFALLFLSFCDFSLLFYSPRVQWNIA